MKGLCCHLGGFLFVLLLCHCSQGPPPAPASNFEFSDQQAASTLATLQELAKVSSADPDIPLDLLPADGVRWETLEQAVNHAVGVPELEMTVVESHSVSDQCEVLYLQNAFSWPATVTIARLKQPPFVSVAAIMGPWPDQSGSQATARQIEQRVLDSIMQYGRIRRLPAYQQDITSR